MGWLTSLPSGVLKQSGANVERKWRYYGTDGWQYCERTVTVTVTEYGAMTSGTATSEAAAMRSDTRDQNGTGTLTTASVEQQNEAGAYRIVKTAQTWSAWGDWT